MKDLFYILPTELTKLQEHIKEAKEGIDLSYFINQRKPLSIDENGIATIHIKGVLVDDAAPYYKELGCTDYRDLISDCNEAVARGAKGVVFFANSGGGMVQGCIEAAKVIENLPIPAVTYCEGLNCSASYKLTCGTDAIIASPSASVGNIGTIFSFWDNSRLLNSMGITVEAITNEGAELKDTLHRLPLTDVQREFLQDSINKAGESFKAHVAANREVSEEVYKAGWYSGQEAVELGLVDAVGSFTDAYEVLTEMLTLIPQ